MNCKKGILWDAIKENGCIIFNYDDVSTTGLAKFIELMNKNKGKIVICPDIDNFKLFETKKENK